MKLDMLILLSLVIMSSCEAKRHRKKSRHSLAHRSSSSGETSEHRPGRSYLAAAAEAVTKPRDHATAAASGSAFSATRQHNNKKSPSSPKPKRKSKRNRKDKKSRQGSKKQNKNVTSQQVTDLSVDHKEMLRSTMRHMFGFDHMTSPRVTSFADEPFARIPLSQRSEDRARNVESSSRPRDDNDKQRLLLGPPDFMLELYRTYSKDKNLMLLHSRSQGNTIRSFFSVAGETPNQLRDKGKPMIIAPYLKLHGQSQSTGNSEGQINNNRQQMQVFAFNITSIPSAETIVAAELRLDGLRNAVVNAFYNPETHNLSRESFSVIVSVYKVMESDPAENSTRNVYQRVGRVITIRPTSSFTWVDSTIARLASKARRVDHLLIVKFNRGSGLQQIRQKRSTSSSLNNHSDKSAENSVLRLPAYFVVMGTDRPKRNSDDNQHGNRPLSSSSSPSFPFNPILLVYCNDTQTIVTSPIATTKANGIWNALRNISNSKPKRVRRSSDRRLLDVPKSPSGGKQSNEFPDDTPFDDDFNYGNRESTNVPTIVDNDQTELHDNGKSQRRVIQSLKDRKSLSKRRKGKRRKRARKCRKRNRKGRKSRKCRKEKQSLTPEPALNRAQPICSRKSLHVDFGDIGWADWIISPKNFDAYYCSGLCEFDSMKKAKPSNHAIIQAFIKAYEINPEVPAPCCVPENLMSLSVLFFDKDDNVVLKAYPNMSVESCACR